jgi:multidrug efflux pump subunit AcrB
VNRAIEWFARNHVAANLIMLMLVVGGLSTIFVITQKTFPDIDIDMIRIDVEYRGAAPEEVEEGICIRIEEEIEGLEGIDEIRSAAVEGACTVSVELLTGADEDQALTDIKNRVDAIDTFPDESEKPIISHVIIRRAVVDVAISGDVGERTLKEIGQRVRDEIAALPEVTQAELQSIRPYEISIEVSEETLRRYGLTFDQVVQAVRRSSLDLPGGSVKTAGGEILLRTKGQAYRGEEFERIVVVTRADGTRLTLGEIAEVVDGFEDIDEWSRFDGKPAVMVRTFRVGEQDTIEISNAVKAYVAEAQARMPAGVEVTVWQDATHTLRSRLDTLLRNGRSGFLLVLLVLAAFLKPRLAFWVTLGVPISFMGALWTLPALNIAIDVISLFAFIVVLGILVDDAVVVGENVHTHQSKGAPRLEGAIRGTQEVAVPVVFGVLTTIVAFGPALLVPGPMGQIMGQLATVVIACLFFSVIESQLVLPAHLSHRRERPQETGLAAAPRSRLRRIGARIGRAQDRLAAELQQFAGSVYRPLLERALAWRYLTICSAIALLLWALGVIASGRMHFAFFPPIEADYVAALLTMPQGTPAEVTASAVAHIERASEVLRAELDPQYAPGGSVVKHRHATVGAQPFRSQQAQNPQAAGRSSAGGAHLGEVVLELIASEEREISTSQVAARWRELTGPIPDATELVFSSDLFSTGEAINIQLQGPSIDDLRRAADRVKDGLAEYPGVLDITDSFRAGKQEVKLAILPSAEPLGLTMQDLARQVRQAFYGEEAQRIQRGRDDVRVMVRYPRGQRRSLASLENMRIRTTDGAEVPFHVVARAELGRGFATIRRADRQRVVNVTADVDRTQTTANEVLASLLAGPLGEILADYPGMSYSLEGEQREQRRALGGLARGYVLALFGIYALLAVPLRSYLQPLIIMSVIPFGFVGAIGGHLLLGYNLSFMSVIGIIALSGVVVNSSLVLVDFINRRRAKGLPLRRAVRSAGVARFRPIVLTALTTFAGLTPLMMERSVQAQFLIPMAVSLAFGVIFATVITLLVVPCAYLILEDVRGAFGALAGSRGRGPAGEPPEPELPAPGMDEEERRREKGLTLVQR